MIIVDETLPIEDLPLPFPKENVTVKFDEDMRDNYDLKQEIGRGRFGTVYLCCCKKNQIKFAAKFVNTKRNQDRENVEREIEIMKILNDETPHPKLIQLYDAYDMGREMCLVLEIVNGGELFERVIDDDFVLTERACAIFIRQIVQGIEFIHSKNILHLDMKPENILCLSREGNRVKICDFGLARKYDPRKKLQVLFGTPEFVAPEVVNFEPISFGTDLWSVGVICYVLLSGLSPFMGQNYVETMTNVTHNKYDFDDEVFDEVSDEVKDFIEHLLVLDKSNRLSSAECLGHKWMMKALADDAPRRSIIGASTNSMLNLELNEYMTEELTSISDDSLGSKSEENIVLGGKLDFQFTKNVEATVIQEITVHITPEIRNLSSPVVELVDSHSINNHEIIYDTDEDQMEIANEAMDESIRDNTVSIDPLIDKEKNNVNQERMSFVLLRDKQNIPSIHNKTNDKVSNNETNNNLLIENENINDFYESYTCMSNNLAEDKNLSNCKISERYPNLYDEMSITADHLDSNSSLQKETIHEGIMVENSHIQILKENKDENCINTIKENERVSDNFEGTEEYIINENMSTEREKIKEVASDNKSVDVITQSNTDHDLEINNVTLNENKLDNDWNTIKQNEKIIQNSKQSSKENLNDVEKAVEEAKFLHKSIFNAPKEGCITNTASIVKTKQPTSGPQIVQQVTGETFPVSVDAKENVTKPIRNKISESFLSNMRIEIKAIAKNRSQSKVYKERALDESNPAIDKITDRIKSPKAIADAKSLYNSIFNTRIPASYNDEEKLSNFLTEDGISEESITLAKIKVNSGVGTSLKRENSNKRKKRDFTEELELTKKHLKDFVERWNSHPNSPYIIDSPKLPANLFRNDNYYSRTSITSIDVAPPSEMMDLSDLDDDLNESFTCYKITTKPKMDQLAPDNMINELKCRLELLQKDEKTDNNFNQIQCFQDEIFKHSEICANQSRKVDKKEIVKESLKRSENIKMRPSRDVMVKDQLLGPVSQSTTPEFQSSRSSTPQRRSRKYSRDEQAHSKEFDRSSSIKTKRRPSRDVPMTPSQIDRINATTGTNNKSRNSTLELWPDVVCITKECGESDYNPITVKLELPITVPDTILQPNSLGADSIKADLLGPLKSTKGYDNQELQDSKMITWAIDLQAPTQLHFIKNINEKIADSTSKGKDNSNSPLQNKTNSLCSINLDKVSIKTPWGFMKRTPLKSSVKGSDSMTIINVKDCGLNATNKVDMPEIEYNNTLRNPLTAIENYPLQITPSFNDEWNIIPDRNADQKSPFQQQYSLHFSTNSCPIAPVTDGRKQVLNSSIDNSSDEKSEMNSQTSHPKHFNPKREPSQNRGMETMTTDTLRPENNIYFDGKIPLNDVSNLKIKKDKNLQTGIGAPSVKKVMEKQTDKTRVTEIKINEGKESKHQSKMRVRKRPPSSKHNDKNNDIIQKIEQMEMPSKLGATQRPNISDPANKVLTNIIDSKVQAYKFVPKSIKIEMQNCVSNLGIFLEKSINIIKCEKSKEPINKARVEERTIQSGSYSTGPKSYHELQQSPITACAGKINQIMTAILKENFVETEEEVDNVNIKENNLYKPVKKSNFKEEANQRLSVNKKRLIIPITREKSKNSIKSLSLEQNIIIKNKLDSSISPSKLLPKPPDQLQTLNTGSESKRNSLIESKEEGLPNDSQKRRYKAKPPPTVQRPIGLFSAQDRISQFEQKNDEKHFSTTPRSRFHTSFNPAI